MSRCPEIVVVGASIAGAQVALRLARAGVSSCVLESRHSPHAKVCGEGLHPAGWELLREVVGDVQDLGVPLTGFEFRDRERSLLGLPHPGAELGLGCDRLLVEELLWQMLDDEPAVDFRRGATVRGVTRSGGRWVVEAREPHPADCLIAADGVRSAVRRAVRRERAQPYGRWGVRQRFRVDEVPGDVQISFWGDGEVFVTPLPGHRVSIAALGTESVIRPLRDPRRLRTYLHPLRALRGAQPLDLPQLLPHRGRVAIRPFAGGRELAGDAGAFLDPISGAGMTLATISARIVSAAVLRGVAVGFDDVALNRWLTTEHRRVLRPYRRLTWFLLALSRSITLRRSAVSLLRRAPTVVAMLSRPTTAAWARDASVRYATSQL